jgi:predicted Zn-dependent peptidase
MFSKFCLFMCGLVLGVVFCHGDVERQRLDKIDAIQLKLGNGMTFCLRSSDDSDEVFLKMSALGGYGSLSYKNFFSGKLADRIALESGIGEMTSDQLSVFLYKNSLEFVLEITPFSRMMEGEGQEESIEAFLQIVNDIFTRPRFTEKGFEEAISITKGIINKQSNDSDRAYEAAFLRVNTQNYRLLRPLTVADLSKVNFEKARTFFKRSFSDPSDFFCVITGNFDVEKAIKLAEKYIAPIPKPAEGSGLKKPFSVPFPPGITETTIKLPTQPSCLTHVTFPLQIPVTEQNINEIAFMCQVIEGRLRNEITHKMDLSYGVDVAYEFPVYPFLENPWISIRYRCEEDIIGRLKEIVLTELRRLQVKGATAAELATIKKFEKGSQEFWLKDDFYWVSMLSNYYLWGWNPEKIDQQNTGIYNLSLEELNALLKKAINLNNYSVITATGQKG